MKTAIQFVVRQIGWLVCFVLLFAVLNGIFVCEGIWQGSGLYGYIIEPGAKGGPPQVVSVWTAFMRMLVLVGLAVPFGLIALRRSGGICLGFGMGRIGIGKAKAMEETGSEHMLQPKRKRAKRR